MSDFKAQLEAARDRFADLQAEYYSNLQFPPTWIDVKSVDGLKQDVNAARRKACYDHHKWGVQKGFNAAAAHLIKAIREMENLKTPLLTHPMNKEGRDFCLDKIDRTIAEITKGLGEVE